ncbi:sensor histidine kinase [Melioribacteraceae bacterium 4301-Me]|uniref:sensor histidine kinase n=1 Tax=Pyranulibacter aquaticus TaxID=3163344 RepID=UPI00359967DB
MKTKLFEKLKKYHFELKHLTVLFAGLIVFQLVLSIIHKTSLRNFVENSQEWYQKHSAERLANLTTTTLELLLETARMNLPVNSAGKAKIIQFFNIIFNQQKLQQNIEDICLLIERNNKVYAIDDGTILYDFIFEQKVPELQINKQHSTAVDLYLKNKSELVNNEQIINILKEKETYYTLVPFAPSGEIVGALFVKNTPDFGFIQKEIVTNYEETSVIYSALFFLGLLAMYYISTYTIKERDEAQKLLMEENERNLKKQIDHEKESLFTKRIYHTHHKAEKVMGFIKEDLRLLSNENIEEIKYRVNKYSNFISRVIYDMKWYDPPIQTIRNSAFNTNINEVIKFIVKNLFNRTAKQTGSYKVNLELDNNLPLVHINEFVIWEIVEPLIQNSIDHANVDNLQIKIITKFNPNEFISYLIIEDNGKGIAAELLEKSENGIKKLFQENVTSKGSNKSSGYGCYIAYEMAERCNWKLDALNLPNGGCQFIVTIPNQ